VDDASFVGVLHGLGQRRQQPRGVAERHRLGTLPQPVGQRLAGAVHRGEEADRADLAGLVDRHQVRVVQPRGRPRLAAEALA
jgi:hypothetical protein